MTLLDYWRMWFARTLHDAGVIATDAQINMIVETFTLMITPPVSAGKWTPQIKGIRLSDHENDTTNNAKE